MGKREGRGGAAAINSNESATGRLNLDVEEHLRSLDMQPMSNLTDRLVEAVLKTMFRIPAGNDASFNHDYISRLKEAERVTIVCQTFYIYYPQSGKNDLEDALNDLRGKIYEQMIEAYEYVPPPRIPAYQSFLNIAAKIPVLKMITGNLPTLAGTAASPSPPHRTGLQKLIDDELHNECKRGGMREEEATNAAVAQLWASLSDKAKISWLHERVFGCWLRPCPKDDPALKIHIVGRPNLYYRPRLEKIESESGETILLAARLKLASGGKLNVHDYNRQSPEYIHIISTREDWEFTMGSREHDHLIIDGRPGPSTYTVKGVKWNGGWPLSIDPVDSNDIVLEPVTYRCPYLEYVTMVTETGYVPNLRPRGRVLPRFVPAEKTQVQRVTALLRALQDQGVHEDAIVSAIQVEAGECWLIGSRAPGTDNVEAWLCYTAGVDWSCQKLEHGKQISTGKNNYIWWNNDSRAILPDCYVGELSYDKDRFAPVEITTIKGQSLPVSRNTPFGLNDYLLSTTPQLKLHSLGRDQNTRALYHVERMSSVSNRDLYIIHYNNHGEPLYLRWAGSGDSDQSSYGSTMIDNVAADENGFILYREKPLVLYGESILLICGTSVLVLNTSSSIPLGRAVESAKVEAVAGPDSAPQASGWASMENVESALHKSPRWADVVRVDRPVGDAQGTYTQGFEFTKDGVRYFVKCYRTALEEDRDNRTLAQHEVQVYRQCADLPVVPPLYDVLPSEDTPQLLVMPKLTPLEVNGLSLAEILAIGYAVAILLERLELLSLVHYDIRTTKFATDQGKIMLIDYNSVFPRLNAGESLQDVHRLLVKSGLPEIAFLSPERREFLQSSESERPGALTKIGPASSVFALAKVLLSIRRSADTSEMAKQWEQELGSGHGQRVGALLNAMLSADVNDRPTAAQVKEEIGTVLQELRRSHESHPDVARAERLLGPALAK